MDLPAEFESYKNLPCAHIWRSVGTHIWFEFGVPRIELLKNGRRCVKGDVTLHVGSDHWRLEVDGQSPLNSDTVTDDNFKRCGPRWFFHRSFPSFNAEQPGELKLIFSPSVSVIVFPDQSQDGDEDDLSIVFPGNKWWGFRFGRGWFVSS